MTCYGVQEIGSAQGHDKKTAKKEAAKQAVDFLLKLQGPSNGTAGPQGPQASASQPSAAGVTLSLTPATACFVAAAGVTTSLIPANACILVDALLMGLHSTDALLC